MRSMKAGSSLLLLSALQATLDSGFRPFLEEMQKSAAEEPERVGSLISWMNTGRWRR